ncbi:MAG TPA: tyrosine-type recombinase/integrase [Ilumatobacter sp.]|nr:tyrosine-type recombinase/integrase [Ilumatobacter sp.]
MTNAKKRRAAPPRPKGTVRQRGGTWSVRWRDNDRQRERGGFATEADAWEYLSTKVDVLRRLPGRALGNATLEHAIVQYLADREALSGTKGNKPGTIMTLRDALAYVTPAARPPSAITLQFEAANAARGRPSKVRERRPDPIAALAVRDVTGDELGEFYMRLRRSGSVRTGRGIGEGGIRTIHKGLSVVFTWLEQKRAVMHEDNPVRRVPDTAKPKATSKHDQFRAAMRASRRTVDEASIDPVLAWHWDTIAELLDKTAADPTPERIGCCLGAAGSLRRAEAVAVVWDDMTTNFTDEVAVLWVSESRPIVNGTVVPGTTKSATSDRMVPLVSGLARALEAWREVQRETLGRSRIRVTKATPIVSWTADVRPVGRGRGMATKPGDPFRADTFSRRVHGTLKELGLPPVDGSHALRHVFGFVFLNEVVDDPPVRFSATDVQTMMGHSSSSITTTLYNRASEDRAALRMLAARREAELRSSGWRPAG